MADEEANLEDEGTEEEEDEVDGIDQDAAVEHETPDETPEPVDPIDTTVFDEETTTTRWFATTSTSTAPNAPEGTDPTVTPTGWSQTRPTVASDADALLWAWESERTVWGDGTCTWSGATLLETYEVEKRSWIQAAAARAIADATEQHFWTDSSGVHVTEVEQGDWGDSTGQSYHSGANTLINSVGQLFRKGLNNILSITTGNDPGVSIFDGLGNAAGNIIAQFTRTGARIGSRTATHTRITDSSMGVYYGDDRLATFASNADETELHFGASDKRPAIGCKYLDAQVEAVRDDLNAKHAYVSGSRVVYDVRGEDEYDIYDTGYTVSANTLIDLHDADGDAFESGGYAGIYYYEQASSWELNLKLSPEAETPGVVYAEISSVRATFDGDLAEIAGRVAEGSGTTASGTASHAEGVGAVAVGRASHAQNEGTIANGDVQTALGKYNVADTTSAVIVGNGTANNSRSNALTVDWDGNVAPSGFVRLKSPSIDRDGSNPSSAIYDNTHSVQFVDKDGEAIGHLRMFELADGKLGMTLQLRAEKTDGTEVLNEFNMLVDRSGNRTYSVSDPAAFRGAIAALGTAGGTVSGNLGVGGLLDVTGGNIIVRGQMIDRDGAIPSSAVYEDSRALVLADKDGVTVGRIRIFETAAGTTGVTVVAFNEPVGGGTAVYNTFNVQVQKDGTQTYGMSSPANFRSAIGMGAAADIRNLAGASSGIFPRSVGGTGKSARESVTLTRSGITTDGTFTAYANGVTAMVSAHNVKLKSNLASGSTVLLGTMPSSVAPPTNTYAVVTSTATTFMGALWVRFENDGEIYLGNASGSQLTTSTGIYFSASWPI